MSKKCDRFFEKLYSENYRDLLKYAYQLTGEAHCIEDIVQDAFVAAYNNIKKLYAHENPVGWLYVAVKTITKAYLREIAEMKRRLPSEKCALSTTDAQSPEALLLSYLAKDEADLLSKFYIYKLSLREIAHMHGIPLSACKMRLKRARDGFIAAYEDENTRP